MRVLILFLALLLSGVIGSSAGSPCSSKAQALAIATNFVKKTTPHLERWERPSVDYITKERKWRVVWGMRGPKVPGVFISVTVDAKTGEVTQEGTS
jgi:hypothetical protein